MDSAARPTGLTVHHTLAQCCRGLGQPRIAAGLFGTTGSELATGYHALKKTLTTNPEAMPRGTLAVAWGIGIFATRIGSGNPNWSAVREHLRGRGSRVLLLGVDLMIAVALRAVGGIQAIAARTLGITANVVRTRLRTASDTSPLRDPTLPTKGKCGRPQTATEDDIAAALRAQDGNQTAAARTLHITGTAIGARLRNVNADSPLRDPTLPTKGKRGPKRGQYQLHTDAEIAAALYTQGGNQAAAARVLGITRFNVYGRLHKAADDSPLREPALLALLEARKQ